MPLSKPKTYSQIEQGSAPEMRELLLTPYHEPSTPSHPPSKEPKQASNAPIANSAGNESFLGLSNTHKGPLEESEAALKGTLRVWEGGKSSHLKLKRMNKPANKKAEVRGKRKVCKGFSRTSRKGMVYAVGKTDLEKAGPPVFWSGTYPKEFSPDWKDWKRDIKVFFKRLVRRWPEAFVLWRLEPQKRGAPHFHFLIWKGPKGIIEEIQSEIRNKKIYVMRKTHKENKELFDWFSRNWADVVGSDDPKHVMVGSRLEAIQTANGILFYVCKYMSKEEKNRGLDQLEWGRPWGVMGRKNWDRYMEKTYTFSEKVFYQIRRVTKRFLQKKTGRKIRIYARDKGFRLGTLTTVDLMRVMALFCYQEGLE